MNVCLEDSFDTVIFFSSLYMPIPSQPGLAHLVRDACYSNDATDVIIPFPAHLPPFFPDPNFKSY